MDLTHRFSVPARIDEAWNAFKRIASGASDAERADLSAGSAQRVYRFDASG